MKEADERDSEVDVKEADVRASGLHGKVSGLQRASTLNPSRPTTSKLRDRQPVGYADRLYDSIRGKS